MPVKSGAMSLLSFPFLSLIGSPFLKLFSQGMFSYPLISLLFHYGLSTSFYAFSKMQ